MKKIWTLSLALMMAASLLAGCGCAKKDADAPATQTEAGAPAEGSETAPAEGSEATPAGEEASDTSEAPASVELPAVSENKEVVKKEQAPKVFLIENPKNNADSLTYHLESCPKLKGQNAKEASWEMIQTIGFWQCPECNPPRYEDYKNAQ